VRARELGRLCATASLGLAVCCLPTSPHFALGSPALLTVYSPTTLNPHSGTERRLHVHGKDIVAYRARADKRLASSWHAAFLIPVPAVPFTARAHAENDTL
jgi:hypothetical protein